jgi:hypothetical protein
MFHVEQSPTMADGLPVEAGGARMGKTPGWREVGGSRVRREGITDDGQGPGFPAKPSSSAPTGSHAGCPSPFQGYSSSGVFVVKGP